MEDKLPSATYVKTLQTLENQNLVCSDSAGSLKLNTSGRRLIELIKQYPDEIREPPAEKISDGTSLRILDFLLEKTGLEIEIMASRELPEHSTWFRDSETNTDLALLIAAELKISMDASLKRLYDLREGRGYLEIESGTYGSRPSQIHAIRITKEGVLYALRMRAALRERENMIDDHELEEAAELHEACLRFAKELKLHDTVNNLMTRYDTKTIFEYSKNTFKSELSYLKKLYGTLRRDYVFEFSK